MPESTTGESARSSAVARHGGLVALVVLALAFVALANFPTPRSATPKLAGALAPVSLNTPVPTARPALSALPTFTPVPAAALAAAVNVANPQSAQPPAGSLPLTVARMIGAPGTGPGQFDHPRGIAVGKDGRVYVVDSGNRRVQVFDAEGRYQFAFTASDGGDTLVEPFGIVMTSKGEIIVMDADDGGLYRYTPEGQPLGAIDVDGSFYKPRGFSIDAKDNLYVTDTGGSRVVKITLDGAIALEINQRGADPGELDQPCDAIGGPSGDVWVSDCVNGRIQLFGPDGAFKVAIPIRGSDPLNGSRLALGADQSLYVIAAPAHTLLKFSSAGKLLGDFGSEGGEPGQFRTPAGITLAGNAIWVADTLNNRIQKLQQR